MFRWVPSKSHFYTLDLYRCQQLLSTHYETITALLYIIITEIPNYVKIGWQKYVNLRENCF